LKSTKLLHLVMALRWRQHRVECICSWCCVRCNVQPAAKRVDVTLSSDSEDEHSALKTGVGKSVVGEGGSGKRQPMDSAVKTQ